MENNDESRRGGGLGAETVYGTHEDNNMVMSEKVIEILFFPNIF